MSTKYNLWLNYDNDKKKFQFPVLPEKIKVTVKGQATSVNIDSLGELIHKGRREAMTVSFSSFFPASYGSSYCACAKKYYKTPKQCKNWILSMMEAKNPAHLVLDGSPLGLNIYAVVTSFVPEEEGGDVGTLYYSIELKEYRVATVKKIKVSSGSKGKNKKTTSSGKTRVNNTAKKKTYTIRKGDCLWNIAKKYYGNGARYTKILNANKSVLDKAARKYGYSNCKNGNLIFPGTKITIP